MQDKAYARIDALRKMSISPGTLNFRSVGVLIASCLIIFLSEGSFKGSGVLYENAVRLYTTTNLFAGWIFSLQMSISFLVAGVGGATLKGVSNRAAGVTGGFLFGLGFAGVGLCCRYFWTFLLLLGVAAFGNGLISFACYMAFYEHFHQSKFAFYNSVRQLFSYLGITLIPPLIELLRNRFGFCGSYLILGAILWNAIICGMLLKTGTGVVNESNLRENGNTGNREEESFAENGKTPVLMSFLDISPIRKHPNLALFVILDTLLFHNFVVWAIFLVSFGRSVGLKPEEAVLLSTAGGVGGCIGKITVVATFHINRMNALTSSLIPAIICNVGLLGYIWSDDEFLLLICSYLCGFSFAFTQSALSGMLPRYVCRFHFRQGSAIAYALDGIFMQFGCIIAGAILDLTSSYNIMFGVLFFTNVVSCIVAVTMHVTYKPVTDCKP